MPVKVRLQRHGKKGKPFYWIVVADSRTKRDGRYLEKLGTYNPNTNPATINLDIDSAVNWLQNGAQPTNTARTILSHKGVLLKNHLVGGIKKGAITEAEAEEKFNTWFNEKETKIQAKADSLSKTTTDTKGKTTRKEEDVNQTPVAAVATVVEEAILKQEASAKETVVSNEEE